MSIREIRYEGKINLKEEKLKLIDVISKATDDELEFAINSHIKSTTTIAGVKYHNAIGAFFIRIENLNDFKNHIINPILNETQDFSLNKYNNDTYKLTIKNDQPAVRNGISNELAVKAEGLSKMIYYYSRKEINLITLGQIHIGNSDVSHTHRRSCFLDIVNVIKTIKFLRENKIEECLNPLLSFCRELIDLALSDSDESPSECLNVKSVIGIGHNKYRSDSLKVITCFPYFPFTPDLLKLKNLITHHTNLIKAISPKYFNNGNY